MSWKRARDVGDRLREAREALGQLRGSEVTQEEFGDLYGVTAQSVSDAEHGRTAPPRPSLARLASRLGISLDAFAEGGERPGVLLRRLAETRSNGEGRVGVSQRPDAQASAGTKIERAARRALLEAGARIRDQLRAYGGKPVPTYQVAGWVQMLLEAGEATPPDEGATAPGGPEGP